MFEVNFREISKYIKPDLYDPEDCLYLESDAPLAESYEAKLLREYAKYGLSYKSLFLISDHYKLRDKEVQTDTIHPKSRTKI